MASKVYELANEYVEGVVKLDPVAATFGGIEGHDHEMTDYSPEGVKARVDFDRQTLSAMKLAPLENDRDRVASELMQERLQISADKYAAGEWLRELNNIWCPVQIIRQCFDLMSRDKPSDWETIAERMEKVPGAVSGYVATLRDGMAQEKVAARRQALVAAEQAANWAGSREDEGYFLKLAKGFDGAETLRTRLSAAAQRASGAYAELADFLTGDYAAVADKNNGVGRERYEFAVREYCGMELDLEETYRWGWEELYRIDARMEELAKHVDPAGDLESVVKILETDPDRCIDGAENFRNWLQGLQDQAIVDLDGTHFDIAEPLKTLNVVIAPPGGAAAPYYTGPSEDFSRSGRTWYPVEGKKRLSKWSQVSIAYHEGVPGHHLQVAQCTYLKEELSRYQRTFGWVSGHGEGWALYAERLMGELGYLDNPDYELGMLSCQELRTVRIIIDIGMHLGLSIPANESFHPGEKWTPELAYEFSLLHHQDPDFMKSEIDRYLGLPGQAISYKVGERVWLEAREAQRKALGSKFDLKAFHMHALNLGSMGLAQLKSELAS